MKKLLQSLFILLLVTSTVMAQNRTITGTVTSKEDGLPIPGVSVKAKGTNVGVSTDPNGKFSLSIPRSATTLEITSIGYDPQTVEINSRTVINISLTSNSKLLSEVVVTGYGVQKRGDVTGSTVSLKGADIAQRPTQSFEQSLGGRATGVQITVPSGVLNAPPVFRIRGTNSISLSSQPLIVVDGVVAQTGDYSSTNAGGNALASINPNDIETIDIAKDAAATAIYGSRAANGVVFITTKKGKTGKPSVSYNYWSGWSSPNRLPKTLDAYQYTDYKNVAVANALAIRAGSVSPANTKFNLSYDANGNVINTDWNDYIYRTGTSQNHTVSITGGTENTKYYLGAGYTDQQGIIKKNDFKRTNVLLNVDSKINDYLSVGGKLSYSDERNLAATSSGSLSGEAYSSAGLGRLALVNAPNVAPYNNDGSYNITPTYLGGMNNVLASNQAGFFNPEYIINNNRSNTFISHIQSNAFVQVSPFKWLNLKTTYGIDNILVDNDLFWAPLHGDGLSYGGYATATYGKYKNWTWTNTAQASQTFGGKHNFDLLIGNEQQSRTSLGFGINRQTLSDPAYVVEQAGYTTNNSTGQLLGENYLLSYFGRLNYDYDKRYFLSANIRQDEYSALGVKKGTFYGISAGWEVTKEHFWASSKLSNIFSSFKIRGSYGKVGNVSGIGDFAIYSTFGSGLYGGTSTLQFSSAGNNQLTWETSKKTDIGVNFGVFKDKLNVEFAYYKNNIDGLIISVPEAPSAGLPTNILKNVGSMYNKGFELTLNATPIQKADFTWSSSFNITFNKNEVTALAPGLTQITYLTGSGTTGESPNRTAPGYSIGYLYVVNTGGTDPATGRRIFYDATGRAVTYQHIVPTGQSQWTYLNNGTAAPAITQGTDAVMYKPTQPKSYGGFDNTFRYKGFDLNVLLTYQFGGYVHYGTNAGLHDQRFWNNAVDVLNYWRSPGDVTEFVRPIYGDNVSYGNTIPLSWNVFSSDYIKLRTISLGYSLPKNFINKAKLSNARLYLSANNLAMITSYPGPDPEVSSNGTASAGQGSDRNTVVNAKTLTLGVNLTF
ncbi:SusC/RagA family TonB-linked outer membrane protein [Pedobacter montanisoli]|uniref:TonB-dependent receptor n=1 Tax=Pedobacter montanisoli TaxID=2923277 RepID=A0ABS9ZSS6_9SPHI|nr:TonB-dependent receptor [Pedobacter montanisoli]MCJ0741650.1 TonB-dependent receptor [Pedobacter montanisoli]